MKLSNSNLNYQLSVKQIVSISLLKQQTCIFPETVNLNEVKGAKQILLESVLFWVLYFNIWEFIFVMCTNLIKIIA